MTQANVLAQIGSTSGPTFRNRIINGAMVIDQRNAGASVTPTVTNQYTLDRWQAQLSVTSKYSVQQNAGSVTPPVGFTNYLGITSLSAYSVSASDYFAFRQHIEGFNIADLGWGTVNAKPITISFWVRSSLTGTFGGYLNDAGDDYCYLFSYSIPVANTWTSISVTIAGPTSGTWNTTNGQGIKVGFGLGTGSTYTSTAGSWQAGVYVQPTGSVSVVGTNGATFYITGVQLEVGSSATGFEYRQYQQELALCQRYYENSSSSIRAYEKIASGTGYIGTVVPFCVTKRTPPTMVYIANGGVSLNVTFSAFYGITSSNSGIQFVQTVGAVDAYNYGFTCSANSEL
jgi:hypothetical protein